MKVVAFYRILLLILVLGFGRTTMEPAGFAHYRDIVFDYGTDTDSYPQYGDIPTNSHILFHERNSELPAASKLKTYPGHPGLNRESGPYLVNRKSLLPIDSDENIKVGLDSLTIIFPFHTFL